MITPTVHLKATLRQAGFAKADVPERQFFAGELNRVSLYQKTVVAGERFQFRKCVLLVSVDSVAVR